ncbi:replication factor C large subunit [Sulfolobales archaeon HS-7]|nr:replication factor C large subunit [Sulfolobales archaeon HS-7]
MSWFIKYRPKSLSEVENQDQVKEELKRWIDSWLKGKPTNKAVLLYGRPGSGKTTLAYAIARDNNFEILETNASDTRNLGNIRRIVEVGMQQSSLFGKSKLILLDEVDGINRKSDEGAIQGILDIISETKYPIIMTANDPWDPKLKELRESAKLIEVPKLGKIAMRKILKKICEKEKIKCHDDAINIIVDIADGDARFAINSLESVATTYSEVAVNLVEGILRRKEAQYDPFETLRKTFWAKYGWQAKDAVTNSEVDYELLMRWFDENIPIQYEDTKSMTLAFESLSRASIFLSRAKKGNWDQLSYLFDMMGPGVSMADRTKALPTWKAKWKTFKFPSYIQMLARSKQIRREKQEYVEEIAKASHCSYDKALSEIYPFIEVIDKKKK